MRKILAVLAIVIALAGVSTQAQQITSGIFVAELFWGSGGALLGGAGGAAVGGLIGAEVGSWGGLFLGGAGGLLVGVPLGATFMVASVGSAHGIEGNPWLALAGAFVGESIALTVSYLAIRYTSRLPNSAWIVFIVGNPVAAALGAALGYNWGAKVKKHIQPQRMSSSSFKLASVTLKW